MRLLRNCLPAFIMLLSFTLGMASGLAARGVQKFPNLLGKLDIVADPALMPVMQDAAAAIMQINPKIRISVARAGSGKEVQTLSSGSVDILATGRSLTPGEISTYRLQTLPLGIDAAAVAVNRQNPVTALTSRQVRGIYAGKIKNWRELGGVDAPIHLFTYAEGDGTRETFGKKLLQTGSIDAGAPIVASQEVMKLTIGQDPQAIGYLGLGLLDPKLKGIMLNGVEPTPDNAKSGAYPGASLLTIITKRKPTLLVEAFISYIRGPNGARILQKHGFIPNIKVESNMKIPLESGGLIKPHLSFALISSD